jgi:4-diphosphocytidyl-2-C-methyl-D-erythritol kinase
MDRMGTAVELSAPAKLTLDLRVTGTRPDGYHELEAEMVALDLADTLFVGPGDGLVIEADLAAPGERMQAPVPISAGPDNLVSRALAAVDRRASVRLVKRIPAGAGLGGGSSDAAAILRWAGCDDVGVAARLGADVPFCLRGGRALVTGIGEVVAPLPFVARSFVLCLPPFGVDTAAVYRMWDHLRLRGARLDPAEGNDLTPAALVVEPRLARWRDVLGEVSGQSPRLAGSGSTWFVEGTLDEVGLSGRSALALGHERAVLIESATLPPHPVGPAASAVRGRA